MDNDEFGNRMKGYESASTSASADPSLPLLARLDGSGFSKLTRNCARPFDAEFMRAMQTTAQALAQDFGARLAYVQSDEISLLFFTKNAETSFEFNGRLQKFHSLLAAKCSVQFNKQLQASPALANLAEKQPIFDCRVWQVPSVMEAMNTFLWRQQDCMKNAISMAAQAHFHHKALLCKSGPEKIKMLGEKGINFEDLPIDFRVGTFFFKKEVEVNAPDDIPAQFRPTSPVLRKIWVQESFRIADLEDRVDFFANLL